MSPHYLSRPGGASGGPPGAVVSVAGVGPGCRTGKPITHVGDLGVSKGHAAGQVVDLKKVEDFEGKYGAAGAGGVAGAGAGTVALANPNGVKMTLMATAQGVRLAVASAGVEVKLKK